MDSVIEARPSVRSNETNRAEVIRDLLRPLDAAKPG
jgi:hypothetical protein